MASSSSSVQAPSSTYLDWTQRPASVQQEIDRSFDEVLKRKGGWGRFNGPESLYHICGVKEPQLIRQIIAENPERTDFYVIDVGAGEFGFARELSNQLIHLKLPRQVTVHVISLRGERHNGGVPEIYQNGICKIYNIGAIKIEEIATELKKHGLDLGGQGADLITSRWCFNHLTDPLGTFVQCYYDLLRKNGIVFSTSFYFKTTDKGEDPTIPVGEFGENRGPTLTPGSMLLKVLAETGAPFLAKYQENNDGERHYEFLVKKIDSTPCQLQLHYEGVEKLPATNRGLNVMDPIFDVASQCVTCFSRKTPFPLVRPLGRQQSSQLLGDRKLYLWLRNNDISESHIRWLPLCSQEPITAEWTPIGTQASGFPKRDRIKTSSIEEFIALASHFDINDCDEDGNTALHIAIQEKRWEIARWLLENGAHPLLQNYENDQTPLDEAITLDESGEWR